MSNALLRGSERSPLPGAVPAGKADPAERLEVTVLLRRRAEHALAAAAAKLHRLDPRRIHLGRREFAERYGSEPRDAERVAEFASRSGLVVVQHDPARRTMVLSGTVAQAEAAFRVTLQTYHYTEGTYRGRVGAVRLPQELEGVVEAVLGLDNRPQAKAHVRVRDAVAAGAAGAAAYSPIEIAALYGFSEPEAARGQTIALIELGGGFRPADLRAYFASLGIATQPGVSAVSVDHAKNAPTGSPAGPDAEVMLDIEVAGALAPGARIVVYFAPNTDAGFINALTTAVHDEARAPTVISISWGGAESAWTGQASAALDQALAAAAMLGVTVCVASGDHGSSDGVGDGHDHVDFPASSPFALACGGTAIRARAGRLESEVVWNDPAPGGASGGGESALFDLPIWQTGSRLTLASSVARVLEKRGVPDVAGDASPESGYAVRVDGATIVAGGTSAVAPLWAALIARANAKRGKSLGFVNPLLYANRGSFRDIVSGDNGNYAATAGWDGCTGLGSPAPAVFSGEAPAEPTLVTDAPRTRLART